MKYVLLLTVVVILSSCRSPTPVFPSEGMVQTAIAQTMAAQPASPTTVQEEIVIVTEIVISPTAIPTDTPTTTPTETPSKTEVLLPIIPNATIPNIDSAACVPRNTKIQEGVVINVVDGDTIDIQLEDDQIFRVRYIGMNTPEKGDLCSSEATSMNQAIVEGKPALLVVDVSEVDKYDRLLRYVFIDDIFVNYELVVQGFAQQVSYPPDIACAETFREAQRIARENVRGCWASTPTFTPLPTIPPTPIPTQPPLPAPTKEVPPPQNAVAPQPKQGNCDPSYPDVCIAPPPPDLDCGQISFRRFKVLPPDPHRFDGDHDGIGCES